MERHQYTSNRINKEKISTAKMPRAQPVRRFINENGLTYRQRLKNRNPQEAVEVNENINRRRRRRQGQERPQEQRNEQEQ